MRLLERLRRPWRRSQPTPTSPPAPASPITTTPVRPLGFAVVDVETTGLFAARDRVVEIAVIHTDEWGRIVDEWTTLLNPEQPVGPTHIHRITAADVRRAPRFADVIGELNSRLAGRALVAHNAPFDLGFLQTEYARAGWALPASPHLCTLDASWTYLPQLSRRRLSDCCWAARVQLADAHCALHDARAAAGLLASYLHPRRPPRPAHVQLPKHAARIAWPPVPRRATAVAHRTPARPPAQPAPCGTLAALLDDLPLSSAAEHGAPATAGAYLELLAEVFEDGVLTSDEARALADLAATYRLSREQVAAAHRGFLLALAHKAVEDGRITRDERTELLAVAAALGFPDGIVKAILDEARAALADQRAAHCVPLPAGWPHGEPVRIGDGIAFTGCDDLERARLEGRARAVGLRVTGSVSAKTVLLVTDGADPSTDKAQAARAHGTRTVAPAVFADLLAHVQPALPSPRLVTSAAHRDAGSRPAADAAPSTTDRSAQDLEDPGTIRRWARAHGFTVATRGRLSTDVITAFRDAHR